MLFCTYVFPSTHIDHETAVHHSNQKFLGHIIGRVDVTAMTTKEENKHKLSTMPNAQQCSAVQLCTLGIL